MKTNTRLALISVITMGLLLAYCTVGIAEEKIDIPKILFARAVETFGIYTEESSNRFQTGAKTVIYMEIANFRTDEKNGSYKLDVALDFSVIDTSGKEVLRQNNLLAFDRTFKSRIHDLFFTVDLGFNEWPAGDYKIILTVRDNLAKNFSSEELPVEIFE